MNSLDANEMNQQAVSLVTNKNASCMFDETNIQDAFLFLSIIMLTKPNSTKLCLVVTFVPA